jgi:hypothetical protein
MTRSRPKPSDRGRDNPEPGPVPGTRASQRDTEEQLAAAHRGDDATEWERSEQENLPPRGEGSQHNQGRDRSETLATRHVSGGPEPSADAAGLQSGGNRGPSNQNNNR